MTRKALRQAAIYGGVLAAGLALQYAASHGEAQDFGSSSLNAPITADQIPRPASTAPATEALAPQIGTDVMRYALEDHVHARITRSVSCVTVTGGTCVAAWEALASVPTVFPIPMIASSGSPMPIPCYPVAGTITTTGATIRCFQTQSILGLGVLPFTTGAAGVTVQVLAIPLS